MDRFREVDDMVLRGGAPSAEDLGALHDIWDVERIVSLDGQSGERISDLCKEVGLEHTILPLGDGNGPNVIELATKIVPHLNDKKTFIHCYHGKDRTGMACAMYRVMNGWPLSKALAEAFKMGMGKGLSPKVKQSYYDAVRRFARALKSDKNNSSDAVTASRDQTMIDNMYPINTGPKVSLPFHTRNFGFTDREGNDYLNRPASQRIYRASPKDKVMSMKQYWYPTAEDAVANGDEKSKLYSGIISSEAKLHEFDYKPTKVLMQAALVSGADIVNFGDKVFMVLNPDMVDDIKEEGGDVNNNVAVMSGTHDNYTGLASFVAPGSGTGFMPGGGDNAGAESGTGLGLGSASGGFAGPVSLPNEYV